MNHPNFDYEKFASLVTEAYFQSLKRKAVGQEMPSELIDIFVAFYPEVEKHVDRMVGKL